MPTRGPGKNKQFLLSRLRAMYGDDFDPVMKMAANASFLQSVADKAFRSAKAKNSGIDEERAAVTASQDALNAWDRIARYTTPQLKAIEHSVDSDDLPTGITVSFTRPPKYEEEDLRD